MQKEKNVENKSFAFAIRIVRLYKFLTQKEDSQCREFIMSKQLLRSGTSIGANVAEAECGISRSDFSAKMYIAYKECAETIYWLRLLHETGFLSDLEFNSIYKDCQELIRMLAAITKSTRARLDPPNL